VGVEPVNGACGEKYEYSCVVYDGHPELDAVPDPVPDADDAEDMEDAKLEPDVPDEEEDVPPVYRGDMGVGGGARCVGVGRGCGIVIYDLRV